MCTEVADGDGRGVGFVEGAFGVLVEDGFGEEGGALHGEERDVDFFFVGAGCHGGMCVGGEERRCEV